MPLLSGAIRWIAVFSIALFLSQLLACGSFYVAGAFIPADAMVMTGTVSFISFTAVSNANGEFYNVTVVTLLAPLGTTSLTLCGDQRGSFVMNRTVQINYIATPSCSSLVRVTSL